MTTKQIHLTQATPGQLQDAYHYAMLILDRPASAFDGDHEYPDGLRGKVLAYERLLGVIDSMTPDNETWQLVASRFWQPEDEAEMVSNTMEMQAAINHAASRLGIEARTGCEL